MTKQILNIWTDGACKGNPGAGGWGALLKYGDKEKKIFGGEADTTNNRMELTAVIKALLELKKTSDVVIHIDSQYVKNGMTQWIHNWKKNNWRTANRKPVKNVDLWQQLDQLVQNHNVSWVWVKGHAGDPGNEMADALANQGVQSLQI